MKTILAARITDELKARLDYINNNTNTKINVAKLFRTSLEKELEEQEKLLKLKTKN